MSYTEIDALKNYFNRHRITITKVKPEIRPDLFFALVSIDGKAYNILIDDEFGDFAKYNLIFDWYLVLRAFEAYEECQDILEWCNELRVTPAPYLDYYKSLATNYQNITSQIGPVDTVINSFDYELRTGVIKALEAAIP